MTAFLPNSPAADSWQRLIVNVSESIPDSVDGKDRTIHNLGQRLQQVLRKRYRWTVYDADQYELAYSKIAEYYAAKDAYSKVTEAEAFAEGETKVWYSTAVLIDMARTAYKYRHNAAALRGLTKSYGRSAKKMSDAVEWFGEWFEEVNPRAQTPQECLVLFAIAGLPKAQANDAYIYWCDHSSDMNYYQALEYVDEIKAQTRLKDFDKFPHYKREVKRGAAGMRKTGSAEKQPAIEKIEAILEREL